MSTSRTADIVRAPAGDSWRVRARWHAKKAARRMVAAATTCAHLPFSANGRRVHALTYHRFGVPGRDPFCVHPDRFEGQMAWLARTGLAVSLARVEAFVAGRGSLPDGAVLVTIDDGWESLASIALPTLVRHAVPAVAFVPAGEIGSPSRPAGAPERRIGWDDLERVAQAGIAVGSHSWTHRSLATMGEDDRLAELERSRAELERRLGRPATAFAYPFGTVADCGPEVVACVREAGYTCAFTARHGSLYPHADPLTLPRIKVEGGDDVRLFRALVTGGLDAWRLVDATLWWAQARP
jgi:peptidoglycan/xylan/chitin deacetylase (PgdA/CDA1 family)